MNPEIPVSRAVIARLDDWFSRLAAPLLPLIPVPAEGGEPYWGFAEKKPETVMVGKAVRMISGIRAALMLADAGFTTECASLLRMVSDFGEEINCIGEGVLEGRMTEAQERFIRQYYAPIAKSPEEYDELERERYVSRDELFKAHYRLAAKSGVDADKMRLQNRFINYTFDKYVHGAYPTSLELYDGERSCFLLNGHEAEEPISLARAAVAGKLHGVVSALHMISLFSEDSDLRKELLGVIRNLDASGEC